jgi:hypothetical protein
MSKVRRRGRYRFYAFLRWQDGRPGAWHARSSVALLSLEQLVDHPGHAQWWSSFQPLWLQRERYGAQGELPPACRHLNSGGDPCPPEAARDPASGCRAQDDPLLGRPAAH